MEDGQYPVDACQWPCVSEVLRAGGFELDVLLHDFEPLGDGLEGTGAEDVDGCL